MTIRWWSWGTLALLSSKLVLGSGDRAHTQASTAIFHSDENIARNQVRKISPPVS
jgi:hypothetical protein